MYKIKPTEVKVRKNLGGQPKTEDKLNEQCFIWLEEAAQIAESLMRQKSNLSIFTRYATDDSETAEQLEDLRDRVEAKIATLRTNVCISEIGDALASYNRGTTMQSTTICINKTLLRELHLCWEAAPNEAGTAKKSKTELRRQWVALLAVKIWRETQHLLLLGFSSKGDNSRVTFEKKFRKAVFRDFGNLIEAAAFGGILTVENWPKFLAGEDLVLSRDESWNHLQEVTSVETIYNGRLRPITVDRKRKRKRDSPMQNSKKFKRASSSSSSSPSAQVIASSQARTPQKLIPKRLWSTFVGKVTKRS